MTSLIISCSPGVQIRLVLQLLLRQFYHGSATGQSVAKLWKFYHGSATKQSVAKQYKCCYQVVSKLGAVTKQALSSTSPSTPAATSTF